MTEEAEEVIDEAKPDAEPVNGAEAPEAEAAEEDAGFVVTIGEEPPPPEDDQPAPDWVRELRKANREKEREIRDLRAKLAEKEAPAKIELGPKPTLADCDYDEAKYDEARDAWQERKQQVEAQRKAEEAERKAQDQAWQDRMEGYQAKRAELKAGDFDEAEDAVKSVFSVTQQGIIVQGASNPALVVYALGKNPAKAKELASIKDPVKFAFAVARLETELKMTPRKPTTQPEKTVTGSGRPSGAVDERLQKLRDEAESTGDWTAYLAAKRKAG